MNMIPAYPQQQPRRLRKTAKLRRMMRETSLNPSDFVYPLFIRTGTKIKQPISSMPGQYQWSADTVLDEVGRASQLGVPAVILFGIPESKDPGGSENYNPEGPVPAAIRAIKKSFPDMIVITDMCFCEYTDHGHCGIINTAGQEHFDSRLPEGYLLNVPTLNLLGRASIVHAEAGADMIAPSGMIDGMVGQIRQDLDFAGFGHVAIMSYAAKYASAFYGPFREAAESPPTFGDRKQYQMDPANRVEAMKEVAVDVAEGADIIMVKPAMPYLDILAEIRRETVLPAAAYQVSGEYAMIHAAAGNGWIDLEQSALESLMCIKRAGADLILTYFAVEAAKWLSKLN